MCRGWPVFNPRDPCSQGDVLERRRDSLLWGFPSSIAQYAAQQIDQATSSLCLGYRSRAHAAEEAAWRARPAHPCGPISFPGGAVRDLQSAIRDAANENTTLRR